VRSHLLRKATTTQCHIWKNEETNLTAAVEFMGCKISVCPVYFLNKVDTVFNSSSDSSVLLKDFSFNGIKIGLLFNDTAFSKIRSLFETFSSGTPRHSEEKYVLK
jgi:hypothetical protein